MTKITPYTALCDIFRGKEQNSDDDEDKKSKKEEEEKPPAKIGQKINNSCQTQTLQDNCFERIIKSQKKPSSSQNIKFHDDNFQILRADYGTYSKDIYHVAEKPQDCEENFTRRRKRRRLSPSHFINKILSRDPSPKRPEMKDCTTITEEEKEESKTDSTSKESNKNKDETEDIYPPLRFNYETSTLPELNYKISRSSASTRAALIEHRVNALYRTLSGLRETFQKKYHFEADEFSEKCLCSHCGALAVVKESLKSPLIFDSNEETEERPIQRKRKRLDEKEFLKLSAKLKILEDRLQELEELTYKPVTVGSVRLKHDMYTQCKGKNDNTSPKKNHKTCGLSFFLPPTFKMFGKKANNKESGCQIPTSDVDSRKTKRANTGKRKKTTAKPKLRSHDYVNKTKTEKTTTESINTNVQTAEYKKSQKEVSKEKEVNNVQKETNITQEQITELLLQLIKNKPRISEGKVVRFELNSKNTNLKYESGVLHNSSILPASLIDLLQNTKNNSSGLMNYELNPEERDTKILYNRGKAFISNSRQNLKSNESSYSKGDSGDKVNFDFLLKDSEMIKKLVQVSNNSTLRSEAYKEKKRSKTTIGDTDYMLFKQTKQNKFVKQEINIPQQEKPIKSQIPRRYVFPSERKEEEKQTNNTNNDTTNSFNQSKLRSISRGQENQIPNTKIPTKINPRPLSIDLSCENKESSNRHIHISRKTAFENSRSKLPRNVSPKLNNKSIMRNKFDKKCFQTKEHQRPTSPVRKTREKGDSSQQKKYFQDEEDYINENYKDSSGTSCIGGNTSTVYNVQVERRSRSFSSSYAKIHSMRINFKDEKPQTQIKRKLNITLPSDRSQSPNSGRSESPTKYRPIKNFIKINKEKCTQLSRLKHTQRLEKERKRGESAKSGRSSTRKSSQENMTICNTIPSSRNNSEKDLTCTSKTTNNISETDSLIGVLKKYSKQLLRHKSVFTKKPKKKKKRKIDTSDIKILRISKIPVVTRPRKKSRSPKKLRKHNEKYELVFKAAPKFDKSCFCRPNMIDTAYFLTKVPKMKQLSMKTMVLSNIDSLQQNYEQSVNKIIILNNPHYGEIPTEISDNYNTSTNTLTLQSNMLENLVPSYIHNDFHRHLQKYPKNNKTDNSSSKEPSQDPSTNSEKTPDLVTNSKSSILNMFKKSTYDFKNVNYQVFVSKSKSRSVKKQSWNVPDQQESIDDDDFRYQASLNQQRSTSFNNVPCTCNTKQECSKKGCSPNSCSKGSAYKQQKEKGKSKNVLECNECPDTSKCGTSTCGSTSYENTAKGINKDITSYENTAKGINKDISECNECPDKNKCGTSTCGNTTYENRSKEINNECPDPSKCGTGTLGDTRYRNTTTEKVPNCNEYQDTSRCVTTFGDTLCGITARIAEGIKSSLKCACDEEEPEMQTEQIEEKPSEIKKTVSIKPSRIPRRRKQKKEPPITEENFSADSMHESYEYDSFQDVKFPSIKEQDYENLEPKATILSQSLIAPIVEDEPIIVPEVVSVSDNKTYYGCDCLANTVRTKCRKCKLKHVEELRKKFTYDDNDLESVSYSHAAKKSTSRDTQKLVEDIASEEETRPPSKISRKSRKSRAFLLARQSRMDELTGEDQEEDIVREEKEDNEYNSFQVPIKKSPAKSVKLRESQNVHNVYDEYDDEESINQQSKSGQNPSFYNQRQTNATLRSQNLEELGENEDSGSRNISNRFPSHEATLGSRTAQNSAQGSTLSQNTYELYSTDDPEYKESKASVKPSIFSQSKRQKSGTDPRLTQFASRKTVASEDFDPRYTEDSVNNYDFTTKYPSQEGSMLQSQRFDEGSRLTQTIYGSKYDSYTEPKGLFKSPFFTKNIHDTIQSEDFDDSMNYDFTKRYPSKSSAEQPKQSIYEKYSTEEEFKKSQRHTLPSPTKSPKTGKVILCPNKGSCPKNKDNEYTCVSEMPRKTNDAMNLEEWKYISTKCYDPLRFSCKEVSIQQNESYFEQQNQCCPHPQENTKPHKCGQQNDFSTQIQTPKCTPKKESKEKPKKKFSFFRKNCDKQCTEKSSKIDPSCSVKSIEKEIQFIRFDEDNSCPTKCTFSPQKGKKSSKKSEQKSWFKPTDSDGPVMQMSSSCMFKFEDPEPCPSRPSRNTFTSYCQSPKQSGHSMKPCYVPDQSNVLRSQNRSMKNSETLTTNYQSPKQSGHSIKSYEPEHSKVLRSQNRSIQSTEPYPQMSISVQDPYMNNPYMYPPFPQYMYPPPKPVTHEMSTQSEVLLQQEHTKEIEKEIELESSSSSSENVIIIPSKHKPTVTVKESKQIESKQIEPQESVYSTNAIEEKEIPKYEEQTTPPKQKKCLFRFKKKQKKQPTQQVSYTSVKSGKWSQSCGHCGEEPSTSFPKGKHCGNCENESVVSFSSNTHKRKFFSKKAEKCDTCCNESVTSFNDKRHKRKNSKTCGRKCEENVTKKKSSLKTIKSVKIDPCCVQLDAPKSHPESYSENKQELDNQPCSECCLKTNCPKQTAASQTIISAQNSGSHSIFKKSVKDSLQLISQCSLCDACRDKVSDGSDSVSTKTCLLPICTRVKEKVVDKITSSFPCKYFKNLTKKPENCDVTCKRARNFNHMNNTYQVNNVECNPGYYKDYDNQKNKYEASSMNTSVLNLYYNVQSFYFENEEDWDWSYSEDDVILTPEEKKRYLLDKLHLLHNFQDQIKNNSSNYGAFE